VRYGGEGTLLSRLGWIAGFAIVVMWIVRDPAGAGAAAKGIGHLIVECANAVGTIAGQFTGGGHQ
jgi:hypothetical protein